MALGVDEHNIKELLHAEGYITNSELIAKDIVACLKWCSRLNVSAKVIAYPPAFTEKERLLCISGLLPVTNTDGSLRVIPVSVYLQRGYPTSSPLCYIGLQAPHPGISVPESTHVDGYGRIHNIPYLDRSVWKMNYNLSVLMQVLIKSLTEYCTMYSNNSPVAFLGVQLSNATAHNSSQHKNDDHLSKSLPASATRFLRSLPQKSISIKDIKKLGPLIQKASRQQKPHKNTPSPSHNAPHPDSSEESACGGGDSPSYQPSEFLSSSPQQPPTSTGTTPISMAHHSYQDKHTPSHAEEEPQQRISDNDHGSNSPVNSHSTEINEFTLEQSSSEILQNIQSLEQSTEEIQELVCEQTITGSEENGIAKQQEELATEKKQTAELKEKIKKLEENAARMQTELAAEKETSFHLQNTVIPGLQERINDLENSLQCLEWVWVIPRDEVQLSDKALGAGGWGTVHEATFRGRKVAAKRLHQEIWSQHNRHQFEKEMRMSTLCRHPNLVEFIGAVRDDPAIIVIELMDKSLRKALTDKDITQDNNQSVYMDVARGLHYLHNLQPYPIIHRDISAPNVLLKAVTPEQRNGIVWIAKLSDFGSAQFAHLAQTPGPGCILYSAPEVRNDEPAQQTVKIDIYSYGVLLAEILTTDVPQDGLRNYLRRVDMQKPQFSALIHDCTACNPDQRPLINDVITQLHTINEQHN